MSLPWSPHAALLAHGGKERLKCSILSPAYPGGANPETQSDQPLGWWREKKQTNRSKEFSKSTSRHSSPWENFSIVMVLGCESVGPIRGHLLTSSLGRIFWGFAAGEHAPGRKQQPISKALAICQMPPPHLMFPESPGSPQRGPKANSVSDSALCSLRALCHQASKSQARETSASSLLTKETAARAAQKFAQGPGRAIFESQDGWC